MEDGVPGDFGRRSTVARRVYVADITIDHRIGSNAKFGDLGEVKIFGTILSKKIYRTEGKVEYGALLVDDGSGSVIEVKAWGNSTATLDRFEQGGLIDVIGKVKHGKDEIFIVPEIIKRLDDPNWGTVRELEIIEDYLRRSKARILSPARSDHQKVNLKAEIIGIIDKEGGSAGIDFTELIKCIKHSNEEEIKKTLNELLDQGIICEIRPGRYRK